VKVGSMPGLYKVEMNLNFKIPFSGKILYVPLIEKNTVVHQFMLGGYFL
jgi:hypothetical protein